MVYLIPALIFMAFVLLSLSIYSFAKSRQEGKDVVAKIRMAESASADRGSEESWVLLSGFRKHLAHAVSALGRLAKPKGEQEASRTRMTLIRAGFRGQSAASVYYGLKVFSALVTVLLFCR